MDNAWMTFLLMAALIATATIGIVRLSRGRTLRRLKRLLDAYADREVQRPTVSRRSQ
jgi:hypothetical protein